MAVIRRRFLPVAACAVAISTLAIGALAMLPVAAAQGAARPAWAAPSAGSADLRIPDRPELAPRPPGRPVADCEQRLELNEHRSGADRPALAIVGASFTAGVGPGQPGQAWAVLLARLLRWDAVVVGDPGAGYVRAGVGRKGPVAAELARVDLRALAPALVIVQAGHDDIGVPAALERQRVARTIATIRAEAPRARIALLTVFPGRLHRVAAERTDRAIVTAARAADRPGEQVIIMDPLTGGWTFARSRDGLHPTAAGSGWIARKVAGILRAYGVLAAPARTQRPQSAGITICDSGIPAPRPAPSPR